MHRVGIIGAGNIGVRRALVARAHPRSQVVAVCDAVLARAAELARQCGAAVAPSWQEVVEKEEIDLVVVATTHDALARISAAALTAGKHVLCEKPMGRNPDEARTVVEAAQRAGRCLKAGYNHRYHPAIQKVQQVCAAGQIGPLLNIRGRYGHGGRPGYEREWRADPAQAGGGELLDQGAHLLDLALWLLGDFAAVTGFVATQFWDMELENNAFGLFRTAAGQVASLHVSWTQWKNLFCLEVCGRDGYAVARGLGRSYGPEYALVGRRRPGDQDLDTKVLRLVETEYLRELGRYRRADLALVRKYGMTFESFIERRIPRQREYSWEVEQDAMAWETAVGGMATVERKLRELRAFSDERTG